MLERAQGTVTVNGQDSADSHHRFNPVVASNNDASNWQPLQPRTRSVQVLRVNRLSLQAVAARAPSPAPGALPASTPDP